MTTTTKSVRGISDRMESLQAAMNTMAALGIDGYVMSVRWGHSDRRAEMLVTSCEAMKAGADSTGVAIVVNHDTEDRRFEHTYVNVSPTLRLTHCHRKGQTCTGYTGWQVR